MGVLILTGPPAAGKNTIAHVLAQKRERCAVIDVDLVRWMYRHPHKAPWEGEEGKRQQQFGVKNACLLARSFARHGIDVVIIDVLLNDTAKLYEELLKQDHPRIVLLMPSFEEARRRFATRHASITENEFKLVYEWQQHLTIYDERIDNTDLSAEETANRLDALLGSYEGR